MAERDAIHPEFADLWPGSRERVDARLADVERGVTALERDELTDQAREAAWQGAHKLVGTLGTYGLVATAARLRELEEALAEPDPADAARLRGLLDEALRAVASV